MKNTKHRGFTLIELLVVIAIIAILAAILFPVFAQAKLAAKKITSVSNVKQVMLGTQMYLSDSDDIFPMGSGNGWWYPRDGGWAWDTVPYIKSAPLLLDISDPKVDGTWQSWFNPATNPGGSTVTVSYASNGFLTYRNNGWGMYGVMGMDQSAAAGGWYSGPGVTNETAITQVANTVAFATRYGGNNTFGCGDLIAGVNWWDKTGAGEIPDGNLTDRPTTPYYAPFGGYQGAKGQYLVNQDGQWGAVAAIYMNQGIFAFADGHAKAMNPLQTDPDPVNQPQNNMWDAYR